MKKELLILCLILLLGAYLRLWRISEYMTFLGDEGRDVLIVKRMIVDKKFTLLGPTTSVGGFFLGPIYYYFMLPFLWLFRLDPTGPAVMVALFGVATIFLAYQTGKEFFNEQVGLIASSLYALSPLVIAHSRSSWNPNLAPFFSLLYIYSLGKLTQKDKWYWWFLVGCCLGIGLQLHYLFTFLVPAGILYLIIFKRGKSFLKKYGISILGFLAGFSPFLAFELRHRFPNTQTIFKFIFAGEETGFVGSKIPSLLGSLFFRLFARLVFYFPPPEQWHLFSQKLIFWWRIVVVFAAAGSVMRLLIQIPKKKKPSHILLLFWLLFGLGLFSFYQREVYDYYLGILFPLPFLLLGNLYSFFWQKKFLRPLVVVGLVSLLVLNWAGRPFKFVPNRQLDQIKKIAHFIFDKTEGKSFNFALITGQNSDHAYRYFLEIWGNRPVMIENLQNDSERKTVTSQLLVVCEVPDCKPLGHPLWEIAGFGRAEIVGEWKVSVVEVYKLVHYQGED